MPTVQNYGQQNYNPPTVKAIPGRNFMYGNFNLLVDFIATFCHADLIVIFRGGPGTTNAITPAIPSGQLNMVFSITLDQPGAFLTFQEDLGDGVFVDMTPAPVLVGAGNTKILLKVNGKLFRVRILRSVVATIAVTWHCSFIGY